MAWWVAISVAQMRPAESMLTLSLPHGGSSATRHARRSASASAARTSASADSHDGRRPKAGGCPRDAFGPPKSTHAVSICSAHTVKGAPGLGRAMRSGPAALPRGGRGKVSHAGGVAPIGAGAGGAGSDSLIGSVIRSGRLATARGAVERGGATSLAGTMRGPQPICVNASHTSAMRARMRLSLQPAAPSPKPLSSRRAQSTDCGAAISGRRNRSTPR